MSTTLSNKQFVLSLFSCCLTLFACISTKEDQLTVQDVRAMTFNIKNDYDKTGDNNWSSRKMALTNMLLDQDVDFLGVQEALLNQVAYIDENLANHTYIGKGRDDGQNAGEFCALFYDSTRYECLFDETFWLSENPNEIAAGWDAALPRIATMGLFIDKESNKRVVVYNTHFDHIGATARVESAKLLAQRINTTTEESIILMGDLNAEPTEEPIKLLNTLFSDSGVLYNGDEYGPIGTFNGFDTTQIAKRRIDYIFTRNYTPTEYLHLDVRTSEGLHISDHHAVVVQLVEQVSE